jgi:hypothetical protein
LLGNGRDAGREFSLDAQKKFSLGRAGHPPLLVLSRVEVIPAAVNIDSPLMLLSNKGERDMKHEERC